MGLNYFLIFACFIVKLNNIYAQYQVPPALIEVLSPKGFRVSIPDDPNYHINIFAFHGKINEEMNGREAGTFSRDITKAKNGRWTFIDKTTKIKPGDVINYWTYVEIIQDGGGKIGFPRDDETFTYTTTIITTTTTTTTKPIDVKPKVIDTDDNSDKVVFIDDKDCAPSKTKVGNQFVCAKKLIFHTSFGENKRSLDNWQKEVRFADEPDFEFVMYTDDKRVVYIKNNLLHIKPTLTDDIYGPDFVNSEDEWNLGAKCTENSNSHSCRQTRIGGYIFPPVISAKLNTKRTFAFKYGRVDIRAKLPKGDWIYPELFLNAKDEKYGAFYGSGQIRIAFVGGNEKFNNKLQGGVILGSSSDGRTFGMREIIKENGKSWCDDFHIFSVIWKPNAITVLVDNQEYGRINYEKGGFGTKLKQDGVDNWNTGTEFAPFDQEMYLTIGLGVGGHSFPDEPNGKPWINNDPKGQKLFYRNKSDWYSTWTNQSVLIIDYINVKAL